MITAYVGLPGSGKTYLMSAHALWEKKKHRREVYSNYPLAGAHYYEKLDQILNVERGIILCDELNTLAPARAWQSLPPAFMNLWTQSRKMGIDFWYTSQNFHRVDCTVRGVTNYVWKCRHIFLTYHVATKYDAADVERDRMRIDTIDQERFITRKKIYRFYDTMHRIVPEGWQPGKVNPLALDVFDDDLLLWPSDHAEEP